MAAFLLALWGTASAPDGRVVVTAATATPSARVFANGQAEYTMFRIPALLAIPPRLTLTSRGEDTLLAFSEARGPNHTQECDNCNVHIVVRRSEDGGKSC